MEIVMGINVDEAKSQSRTFFNSAESVDEIKRK